MEFRVHSHLVPYSLKNFDFRTLEIESRCLKNNPLGDPTIRYNPILIPKTVTEPLPVVFVLSGFTGNGPKSLNIKSYEPNMPQTLDDCMAAGVAPAAIYVLVDAWTYWGGSQFINSQGTGQYEDYIMTELLPAVEQNFLIQKDAKYRCVCGASSGGYGALHLGSQFPDQFGLIGAIAPDSFFEMSLLPEIYRALPLITKIGGLSAIKKEMQTGRLLKRREAHTLLNVIGMMMCYCPSPEEEWEKSIPIDFKTGKIIEEIWQIWLEHDPVRFLPARQQAVQKVHRFYLDVGQQDQFFLQYGTRRIKAVLDKLGATVDYTEFDGNHFDIGDRRPQLWQWLKNQWN